jgi:imidazolonepropionase-like amidohydrolase
MVHAGMPVLAAIRAATQVPAEILELPDRGTLERGKQADFIVLNSNPIENIANTRDIAAVYLKGSAVDRASLRRMWASEPTELDEPTTFQGFVRPRS